MKFKAMIENLSPDTLCRIYAELREYDDFLEELKFIEETAIACMGEVDFTETVQEMSKHE